MMTERIRKLAFWYWLVNMLINFSLMNSDSEITVKIPHCSASPSSNSVKHPLGAEG